MDGLSLSIEHNCDVPQLAGQLAQLTALQELGFSSCYLYKAKQLQPLVDAVVGMASLRSFDGGRCVFVSNQQRAQLQAATQLTKLVLR